MPEWAMPAAAILLLIGLVVVLATAWVQSHPLTPHREAVGEVPPGGAIDLGGIREDIARGRLPHLTWGRALAGGVIAFALLFGIAGLYVVIQDHGRSFAPADAVAESAAPGLAILPFTVQGAGLESWRESMVDLLATGLDGVEGLRTIDSRTVLARWREAVPEGAVADLATSLDVGRHTGARYVLVGSAVAIGPAVRLTADVYDAEGGGKLGQGTVEGAPDSLFALVDRLSIEVLRAILGAEGGPLPQVDLARATTTSLPALKAYLEGEALFRRSDFAAAIPFYERAVAADSTFALALYRLALTYGWAETIGSELAERASEGAARFADRLPERDAILVRATHALYDGTLDGLEPLREAVRRFPDDVETWYQLGDTSWHLGPQALVDLGEADRAFARAIELDPTFTPAYIHRIDWAFYQADSAMAAGLLGAYLPLSPRGGTSRRLRLGFDLAFGDSLSQRRAWSIVDTMQSGAGALANNALNSPRLLGTHTKLLRHVIETGRGDPVSAAIGLGFVQAWRGQPRALVQHVETQTLPPEVGLIHLYVAKSSGIPIPNDALQRAVTAAAVDSSAYGAILFAGALAAERGDEAAYAAALANLHESSRRLLARGDSVDARFAGGAARALEGHRARLRGRRDEALRLLQSALPAVTGFRDRGDANETVRWWIGELLAELDRPREALPYFESLLPDNPLASRRLGELYEETGEWDKAREAYEVFLIAWEDAEPEMAPEVERVRRRAIALQPLRRE
jgi:tetratricopeptide (TPR) repeat protein